MTQDQLLSGLKKDIRSLLISAKHGLSPEQLKRDYHSMLGHPVPLKIHGFRNVLDMVKEMPDVVQLDYAVDGSVLLKAIGDETTKGIQELVSKQRDHKSKSSTRKPGLGTYTRYSFRQPPAVLPRRGLAPPTIPALLRLQLRQLLSHGPVGLSELETRYTACFGRPLVVMHYGFYSIAEMIAAASDLIIVRQTRSGSQLFLKFPSFPAMHVPTLRAMPPKRPTKISNSFSNNSVQRGNSVFSNTRISKQEAVVKARPDKLTAPVPESGGKEQSFEKSVAKLEEELRQRIQENGDAGTVSQELKEKLRKVVAGHSQGLAIHELPSEYKKMYGEDLPVAQCGFLSVTEMVGALSDTFYLQSGPKHGANQLLIMELNQNGTQSALSSSEGDELLNPTSKSYYFSCPESAWEQQKKEAGEPTDSSESDAEIRNKTVHQHSQGVTTFPVAVVGCAGAHDMPLDALRCQKLKAPGRRNERELVPVLVERSESPGHFCVRFSGNQEARTLENMIFEMRSCYTCPEVTERYRLPDAYVRPGQVCCVAPRDVWFYRVVIHRVLSATQVEVYYVDFGDLATVNRSSLRFLKSCYAELPAQAVPSVLVGVKPLKGIWTKDATSTFQKLCYERTLVAAIHSYQDDILLLFLCDTNTEEDVYIHKSLQAEGHGTACSPASTPMFWQFNPVTLYLGEGQLEEIKDDITNVSSGISNEGSPDRRLLAHPCTVLTEKQQASTGADGLPDLTDLPELELIHVNLSENPFEALVKTPSDTFSTWDHEWSEQNQAEPTCMRRDDSAQAVSLSPVLHVSPSAEGLSLSKPMQESKQAQEPAASTIRTLSLHTPGLIRSTDHTSAYGGESFHGPPACSVFPSCFSRPGDRPADRLGPGALFPRRRLPVALGPAACMAGGSSLLHWHPHKGFATKP